MTRAAEYLRGIRSRHLPGARSRTASAAFRHGWHAGYHRAAGTRCAGGGRCEILLGMDEIKAMH